MTVQAALVALAVVGVVSVLLVVATVTARLERERRARSLARLSGPHRSLVLDVASGEDDDGSSADVLAALPPRTWRSLRGTVVALLTKVRGQPAADLVRLLERHGDLTEARRGTRSLSANRRAESANLLGLAKVEDAVPDLVGLLDDRAADVRLVAARALGHISDPRSAGALLQSVLPSGGGRAGQVGVPVWIVADGLLHMEGIDDVVARGLVDEHAVVRGAAAQVAAHRIMTPLLPLLRERLAVETEPTVRADIALALGRYGTGEDAGLLADRAGEAGDPGLRRACVAALGELGHREAEPALTCLLADPDRRLSAIAADALVDLGPPGMDALRAATAQGDAAARAARAALECAALRSRR